MMNEPKTILERTADWEREFQSQQRGFEGDRKQRQVRASLVRMTETCESLRAQLADERIKALHYQRLYEAQQCPECGEIVLGTGDEE